MTPGLAEDPAGPDRVGEEAVAAGAGVPSGTPPDTEGPEGEESGADAIDGSEGGEQVEAPPEDPLTAAARERDEYLDLAQRTRAEFDNYRKRVAAESGQAVLRGRVEVAEGVIEALDNIERAMEAEGVDPRSALEAGIPEGSPVILQGMVVAYRDLVGALDRAGIEQFDPVGEEFDPNLHEALQAIEAQGTSSGVVLDVMQRGYRAGDQVVRAARVVVSK